MSNKTLPVIYLAVGISEIHTQFLISAGALKEPVTNSILFTTLEIILVYIGLSSLLKEEEGEERLEIKKGD